MSDPILGRIVFGDSRPERPVDWQAILRQGNVVIRTDTDRGHSDSLRLTDPQPEEDVGSPVSRVKRYFDPLSGAEVHDEVVSP